MFFGIEWIYASWEKNVQVFIHEIASLWLARTGLW